MKKVKLTQGQVTLVDDEDFERVNQYKWCACYDSHTDSFRVMRVFNRKTIYLHNFILNEIFVDHVDHDTLNNQKSNLRKCTNSQNQMNRKKLLGTSSQYKGVCWNKRTSRWISYIQYEGARLTLGSFVNEEDAAIRYNQSAIRHFGEFALLNKVA